MGGFTERSLYMQVNRVFHDTILASPLVQLKIDLFAAGLEHNATSGIDLAESREAFLQYSASLNSLRPIEERLVEEVQPDGRSSSRMVGGVYAVFTDSVRLFSLGSASRRIPYKEWEIPSPIDDAVDYDIYPGANLIAFVEWQSRTCVHYLQELLLQAHSNIAVIIFRLESTCGPCQMADTIPWLDVRPSNTRGQIPAYYSSTPYQ